ncbi:DegT/DnrJ/EryC1/StrS family aminotransferase [Aestuariispira ectoiniformans]|uniref:DegT/DnrJ/EryC1/StrS family aminotransferase n=1 Tax=Aestuariispira ectoiniformans TaxID=2775080 RepID=UPI00223C4E2D|nr:DegT/DnrJ/EryC1/StrS family aminotransferase [Aestuariispira ectoiniformans]
MFGRQMMVPRLSPNIPLSGIFDVLRPSPSDAVALFEAAFAELAGTRHAIAFPYGRTGLICLLDALGLTGRQVICPSYTCVVVPHAVEYSGNESVFVDVAKNSFLMDMALVEQAANENTGALIATSIFGEPVDLEKLSEFQRRFPDIPVIQDCAHSFFCTHNGQPVHKHGVAAVYGLNFSKLITSVFGGMVTTDDPDLAEAVRVSRQRLVSPATQKKAVLRRLYYISAICSLHPAMFGLTHKLSGLGVLDRFIRYFDEYKIDMPLDYLSGMSPFEAMVGISQISQYRDIVSHRRMIADHYRQNLMNVSNITLPDHVDGSTYSHYVVRTNDAARYLSSARDVGIELGELIDYFIPDLPAYKNHLSFGEGFGRDYVNCVVNLPVHRGVDLKTANRIIEIMQN